MRKKLDTRFPAARIKKIMQADEDVGKIAMAVPLLVSKALELFLQDLCDQTYEITLKRGAKTMNSHHLKQCVQTFNVFDFLRDIVKKVPDLGGSDAAGEDRFAIKRRKVVDDEDIENDEDSKRTKTYESTHSIGSGRGRGRGRGKGRGRGRQTIEGETAIHLEKFEDDPDMPLHRDKNDQSLESSDDEAEPEELKENISGGKTAGAPVRNFDLNVGLDENGDSATLSAAVNATSTTQASAALPTSSTTQAASEMKHEEYPGWSLDEMERMAIDPLQLANLNSKIDEEDYDEES